MKISLDPWWASRYNDASIKQSDGCSHVDSRLLVPGINSKRPVNEDRIGHTVHLGCGTVWSGARFVGILKPLETAHTGANLEILIFQRRRYRTVKIGYAEERESVEWSEDVFLTQLVFGEKMSVQQYRFEPGSRVDTHSHPHEQSGFIYQGSLTFLSEGREETLGAGDSYVIPGGEPHAVENRGDVPARGVDIFSPPRGEPDWEKPG